MLSVDRRDEYYIPLCVPTSKVGEVHTQIHTHTHTQIHTHTHRVSSSVGAGYSGRQPGELCSRTEL